MNFDFEAVFGAYNEAAYRATQKRKTAIHVIEDKLRADLGNAADVFEAAMNSLRNRKNAVLKESRELLDMSLIGAKNKSDQERRNNNQRLEDMLRILQRLEHAAAVGINSWSASTKIVNAVQDAQQIAALEAQKIDAEFKKMSEEAMRRHDVSSADLRRWHDSQETLLKDQRRIAIASARLSYSAERDKILTAFEQSRYERNALLKQAVDGSQSAIEALKALDQQ